MRRYNHAAALLASLCLMSGCRTETAHSRWSSPVRAVSSCTSVVFGGSSKQDSAVDPVSPEESAAEVPYLPPESDEPDVPAVDESLEDVSVDQDVNADQPAPFPTEDIPVNNTTWSLEKSAPSTDPVESLRLLGGILKFSDEGGLLVADLTETAATDADVESLTQIESLRAVDLSGTQVTNACLKGLFESSKLKMLGLCDLPIDDHAIRDIIDLEDLRFLSLERTAITDDGLRYLRALIHLEGLSVRGTEVSREAILEFERAHPNCRVLSDYDDDESSLHFEPTSQTPRKPNWAGTITDAGSWPPEEPQRLPHRIGTQRNRLPDSDAISSDDPEKVVQQLQQIVSERLSDQVVLAAAGKVYLTQRRWEDAVSVLSAALEQAPYDDRVRFDLAVALGHSGDIDESLQRFTEVIGPAAAHYNIGVLLYEEGKTQMSRYFFRQACERDPRIEYPDELVPQLTHQTPPGIQIQQDAMRAVSSSELLKLVAGPTQKSQPDENWTIEIVPGGRVDAAPRCLTTLRAGDAQPAPPVPSVLDDDLPWISPIGWKAAE
ncbi:MAG: tetratricopeptide repeat protein [Planctomycetaceae bacterium]|nr:tetratricopeptide repeat protein [Planctomycetaceae bacterium]